MLRLPAFGRGFRDRSLAGWDPNDVVIVGCGIWFVHEWPRERLLIVPDDAPVLRLDFRMLAGVVVGVVCDDADLKRACAIAERIFDCGTDLVHLIAWDRPRGWELGAPWDPAPPDWVDRATQDALRAKEYVPLFGYPLHWWFKVAMIGNRCAAAKLRTFRRERRAG